MPPIGDPSATIRRGGGNSRLLSIVLGLLTVVGWGLIAGALLGRPDLAVVGLIPLLAVFVLGRVRYGREYRRRHGTAR